MINLPWWASVVGLASGGIQGFRYLWLFLHLHLSLDLRRSGRHECYEVCVGDDGPLIRGGLAAACWPVVVAANGEISSFSLDRAC